MFIAAETFYCATFSLLWLTSFSLSIHSYGQIPLTNGHHINQVTKSANQLLHRQTLQYYSQAKYYSTTNIDSARHYGEKCLTLIKLVHDPPLQVKIFTELGLIYDQLSNHKLALSMFNKAVQVSSQFPNDTISAFVESKLATLYLREGDYRKSTAYALLALKKYETRKDYKGTTLNLIYNTLGAVNIQLKNDSLAFYYLHKQKDLSSKQRDLLGLGRALGNISELYLLNKHYQEAERYARQSLQLFQTIHHVLFTSITLSNLGSIKAGQKQFDQAIAYQKQSLQLRQQLGAPIYVARSYLHLAEYYLALDADSVSLNYSKQAIDIFKASSTQNVHLMNALETEAKAAQKLKNYQLALTALIEAVSLKDSLVGLDKSKIVLQLQSQFDLERKQTQIQLLSKNLAIQKLVSGQHEEQILAIQQSRRASELQNQLLLKDKQITQEKLSFQAAMTNRQKIQLAQQYQLIQQAHQRSILLIIILLLVALLTIIIFSALRRQAKAKQLLLQQNEEIRMQAHQLQLLNNTKDKLFSLISHDLRSPVAHLRRDFFLLRTLHSFSPTISQTIIRLETQVDHLLELLTNLLDWSLSQLEGFQPNLKTLNVKEVLMESVTQLADQIRQKNILLLNQTHTNQLAIADKRMLASVIRNILMNAIKFTPEKGYIRLSLSKSDQWVDIIIQDTGVGMSKDQLDRLYTDPELRKGTSGEPGTGLGLRLCRDLLAKQGGLLKIDSKLDKGTIIRITLPAS